MTSENLQNHFNIYNLQKSNIIRNSKGCWWHIFWNIPLGLTNSLLKNILKKSENIVKSPDTTRWLIILLWLSRTNLANACIFKNWEQSELIRNSNSSSEIKNLPHEIFNWGGVSSKGVACWGSLSQGWIGKLFSAIFFFFN